MSAGRIDSKYCGTKSSMLY